MSKLHRIIAWCSVLPPKLKFCQYQQKIIEKQKFSFSGTVLFHRKTTVCLKYFGQDCSTHNHNDSRSNPPPLGFSPFPGSPPENEIFGWLNQSYFKLLIKQLILIQYPNRIHLTENFTFKRLYIKRLIKIAGFISIQNVMKKLVFLQFTNILVQIEISGMV